MKVFHKFDLYDSIVLFFTQQNANPMQHWEIALLFFIISLVYSSVGFGGGSSYLAVLTFYQLPFAEMKITALVCNIIVVTGGTIIYVRNKQVDWKKMLPLIIASIPMAYIGAMLKLKKDTFFLILGFSLLLASILLWITTKASDKIENDVQKKNVVRDVLLGGAIGFLSGVVGIGGGIFLSPLLHIVKWDRAKKIAATASLFILVNSMSGIAGQLSVKPAGIDYTRIGVLCAAVLLGGQIGSRMGAVKFNPLVIRRVTAVVVFIAAIDVIHSHLPWFK